MIDIEELKNKLQGTTLVYLKGAAAVCVAVIFVLATNAIVGRVEKRAQPRKASLKAFYAQKEEYIKESAVVAPLEKKLLLPPSGVSPVAIIGEIGAGIGIKSNISSFKPFEDKALKGYVKNGVEVRVEGITLNQLVNLVYGIENYRNLLLIKDFSMKSRFDNPDIYDVTAQVVLVSRHE
jgi:general secretion pathway protein M